MSYILHCAILLLLLDNRFVSGQNQTIQLQSEITSVQPMTGIVFWTDNQNSEQHKDAISLEFRYCGYDEVVRPDGTYDFAFLDKLLDDVASRNHQAILRFYFCYVGKQTTVPKFIQSRSDYKQTVGQSEGKKTEFCDWSNPALQKFTLEFYTKLAKRYDNDPRLAFLQTGFGLWAEYHIYDGPRKLGKTFPSKAFQEKFLKHLDTQFHNLPWSVSIDVSDKNYSPLENHRELLNLNFGAFDDSFLCRQHAQENAIDWKIIGNDRWKRCPCGGEFSYYNRRDQKQALAQNGPNGVSLETSARQFHISYMIGNDQPRYQPVSRIKAASMALGYRFRITAATVSDNTLTLTVTNEGIAPIYRDAYVAAGQKRSQNSLTELLPGMAKQYKILEVTEDDLKSISIQSDAILPGQTIQFAADIRQ